MNEAAANIIKEINALKRGVAIHGKRLTTLDRNLKSIKKTGDRAAREITPDVELFRGASRVV